MEPATSPLSFQNVQRSTKSSLFFHQSECHTVHFLSHPSEKSRINVLIKLFSIIRIDKQFELQVLRFHIDTESPTRPDENKVMSLSHSTFLSASVATQMLLWMSSVV